ncbi:MAG TPA: DUF6516 family protein [Candidatus Binatia bacterium]|nr:DUF6516 family protein [Candidatus Binatia bacterium]
MVADDLHYRIGEREVISEGTLRFLDGYELEVARRQEVTVRNGEPRVRTVRYSYHALHRGRAAVRSLFRYDNVHPHPGHETPHHRHEYDWNGNQINPPKHVGEDGWPTLGDVIDELHEYWRQTR